MSAPRDVALEALHRDRAVLVVVDVQEKLLPAIAGKERVLGNSLLLMRAARELELPVVLTTQYEKGLGPTVPEVRAEAPEVTPVDKVAFGCFGSEDFLARLSGFAGRDQLLVAGIESHICVAQTVLGALAKGYDVHVAADAVGARTPDNREVGLRRMERAGAVLSSAEMAVYELLARSDGAAFKRLLPYLKGPS
ncbi:MAG TPA: hydrolase [Vicinamibacteria bacterium]